MKQLLPPTNATFNASAKTITFATTIPSTISHILHVTNVTRGVLYFQPQAGSAFTGTYTSPVLTLVCSTSGHDDADNLEIFYDDNLTTQAVTGPLTDAQLRATAVPVSGTVTATTGGLTDTQLRASAVPISGTVTANQGGTSYIISGLTAAGSAPTLNPVSVSGTDGGGLKRHLLTSTDGTLKVDGSAATQPVSGTFWQATQPVSIATNTPDVTDRSARLLGHVTVDSAPTTAVTAASLPLPSGAATESTLDTRTGSLTETAPTTDTASSGINGRLQRIAQRISSLITALGSPFQAGGSIGNTTFASTQSGTWTVQPGNTANTTAWKVDGSAVTQPVSSTTLATAANQSSELTVLGTTSDAATGDATGSINSHLRYVAGATAIADNGVSTGNPVYVGGLAVAGSTYAPAYTAADRAAIPLDKDSGGVLAHIRKLTAADDKVTNTPIAASLASSGGYETNRVVKASAGTLFSLKGYNSKTSSQFIQVHNATSLPADAAVPVFIFTVAASSNFDILFAPTGLSLSTGIVVCNSSTGPSKTIGSDDVFFTAAYL